MAQFPFVGSSYKGRSLNFSAQQSINLFPANSENSGEKAVSALFGTPGKRVFATTEEGTVRGVIRINATTALSVTNGTVYKVSTDGTTTSIGNIVDASTPVSMAYNGFVVMLVTGTEYGYFIDPVAETVTQITDDAFTGATKVRFVDGYFVFNQLGTGRFQISSLNGTDIDGADFATAEGAPDNIVDIEINHREVWLFGEYSAEVWFNSGNPDFPFSRIDGAFVEQGSAASYSSAKLDSSIFWLTFDDRGQGMVARSAGYDWQRVSTHAVEYSIAQMSDISDAIGYSYQQEGHTFYVLSFPSGNKTWVYDVSMNAWHERAWRHPDYNSLNRDRSNCLMNFAGKIIVGDHSNGKLYSLDMDYYLDDEDPIARIRVCPHAKDDDYHYLFFASLQVDMQTGVGLTTGQGENPQAVLQWSDDGGYVWNTERWASFGRIGERLIRVRWRRLGKSRDRVFKVTITDPVPVVIIGASVLVARGTS